MNIASLVGTVLYDLGLLLFGLAVFWDLVSMVLIVRRLKNGSGPSAVPVVSWIIYFLWIIVLRDMLGALRMGRHGHDTMTLRDWRDFGTMTVFHLCCHALVPWVCWRWLKKRRAFEVGLCG
jgi:hypothetical protein